MGEGTGTGNYVRTDNPADYTFKDAGGYGDALKFFQGQAGGAGGDRAQMDYYAQQGTRPSSFDPNAFMTQFMAAQPGLFNMVGSQTGALGNQLNALAQRSSRLGGEAALASMPGAQNSGAGMAAFADAYANPFAQAAAQTQQAQLGLYGNLAGQSMGQFGQNNIFGAQNEAAMRDRQMQAAGLYGQQGMNAANMYGNLAGQQGQWINPTYEYNPSWWEKALGYAPAIGSAAQAVMTGIGSL